MNIRGDDLVDGTNKKISILSIGCVLAIATFGLLGYIPDWRLLGSLSADFIPMAPSTAISFILLASILLLGIKNPQQLSNTWCQVVVSFVSVFGFLKIAEYCIGVDRTFEEYIINSTAHLGDIPIGVMSPSTGAIFILSGVALSLRVFQQVHERTYSLLKNLSGGLAIATIIGSSIYTLGYIYGTPLLYDSGRVVPMALTTALSFLALGIALVSTNGKRHFPLSLLVGSSISARMIRVFVPIIVGSVVGIDILGHLLPQVIGNDRHPILDAIVVVIFVTIIVIVVLRIGKVFNNRVELADKALRESEEGYRILVEGTENLVTRVDHEGRFIFVNQTSEKVYGLKPQECVGLLALDFVHPDDRDKTKESFDRWLSNKVASITIENRQVSRTGEVFDMRWTYSLVLDGSGQVAGINGIAQDITERKRAEKEIECVTAQLQTSIEQMPIGYILWDKNRTTLEWNKAAEEIFGYTSKEMIGHSLFDAIVPKDALHLVDQVAEELFAGKPSSYSAKNNNVRKDGALITCLWHNTPLSDANGQVTSILSMVQDVTDTRRLEELESRAERLEMAGTIAGQVAHDFNNLLAPMMAYPEFIREKLPEDHSTLKYLDQIEKAAQKIADINQQLLTLGRRGHYNQDVLNLNTIVDQAIKDMPRLADNVTRDSNLDPNLMNILGGGSQIHRVITNLLCNAVDALQDIGHINIKTENYYADDVSGAYGRVPKGEYVKLTISDTGCGISDDIVQKILDPFFTTKTSDKHRGSGLGLSVVDAVIKDHNGYLDLKTQAGKGTSFYIYFPTTRILSKEDHSDDISGGSETILVVDDDNIQREVSTQLLKRLGYEVNSVESGEKAIELLREKSYDLVILDMIMPGGIDGAETYKQLIEIIPNQRTIIVSGFSESDRVKEAQELGAGAFVKKPLTKKDMAVAVRTELDKKKEAVTA